MNSKNWYLDQAIICEGIVRSDWATQEDKEKYTRLMEKRFSQALYLEKYPDRELCDRCGYACVRGELYRGVCERCRDNW